MRKGWDLMIMRILIRLSSNSRSSRRRSKSRQPPPHTKIDLDMIGNKRMDIGRKKENRTKEKRATLADARGREKERGRRERRKEQTEVLVMASCGLSFACM